MNKVQNPNFEHIHSPALTAVVADKNPFPLIDGVKELTGVEKETQNYQIKSLQTPIMQICDEMVPA
jgi:hypothetical protein